MSDSPSNSFQIVGAIVALLLLIAVIAIVAHFVMERDTAATRSTIEQRLQRYNPTAPIAPAGAKTKAGHAAAVETSLSDTIDGSGIPKVRAVSSKVVMLAYGYQLSSPAAEEIRLSSQKTNFSAYTAEMLNRKDEEREWYRNVVFTVMLEKLMLGPGQPTLGILPEVTREMTGSVGIVEFLERVQEIFNLGEPDCHENIAKLLNEALERGQGRTKYVICRALGLLFKEPKMSDKNADLIIQQSRLYAEALELSGLFTCSLVYPFVYEVIERVIQLRTPEDARRPSTRDVVDHLLETGDEHVYLAYILHVKKLPHCPYVPKELVVSLLLLAKISSFHAGIVDEIFANNLGNMLEMTPRRENAPFVCLTKEIINVMPQSNKVVPDTCLILKGNLGAVDDHRKLIDDGAMMEWLEEEQASFRKKSAQN